MKTKHWIAAACLLAPWIAGAQDTQETPDSMYFRAIQLRFEDRLDESYEVFAKMAAIAPSTNTFYRADEPEFWLGRICVRMGKLDEAMQHFQKSLAILRAGKASAPASKRLSTLISEDITLSNIIVYQRVMGYIELATRNCRELSSVTNEIARVLQTTPEARQHIGIHGEIRLAMSPSYSADQLASLGRLDEARAIHERVLEATPLRPGHEWGPQLALKALVAVTEYMGKLEEAEQFASRARGIPFLNQYNFEWYLMDARHAYLRGVTRGFSEELLRQADTAVSNIEAIESWYEWLKASTYKARLLALGGRDVESRVVLADVIKRARSMSFRDALADALVADAEILAVSSPADTVVGAELEEALLLYRRVGSKLNEPRVYDLYASWLCAIGHADFALRTCEQNIAICRSLNLEYCSAKALLTLVAVSRCAGDESLQARATGRLQAYLDEHPGLPRATLAEAQSAIAGRPQAAAKLSEHGTIILQPRTVSTRVAGNEVARGRFLLVNAGTREVSGYLSLNGRYACGWTETDRGVLGSLKERPQADEEKHHVKVMPGQDLFVFLEAAAVDGDGGTVTLSWENEMTSQWDFGFTNDMRAVAVVDASLAEQNPFYAIPFYHDVYSRVTERGFQNIKAELSAPGRLELYEETTGRLLAVDNDGDGNFESKGDAVYVDQDENGWPDIPVDAESGARVLQLLVFPKAGTDASAREVTIRVSLESDGAWMLQAEDTLLLR